jgi:hypothetical protein
LLGLNACGALPQSFLAHGVIKASAADQPSFDI